MGLNKKQYIMIFILIVIILSMSFYMLLWIGYENGYNKGLEFDSEREICLEHTLEPNHKEEISCEYFVSACEEYGEEHPGWCERADEYCCITRKIKEFPEVK